MNTENRAEGAVLEPTHEQLAIAGIVGVAAEESADICRPVRQPGHGVIQPGGNLPPQRLEVGRDVSGPCGRRVALHAEEAGASQDEDALFIRNATLPIVNRFGGHEGVGIRDW